ncbi:uncharacterized protein LOC141646931 [Silene latifolia]|uniref:uncharacterized protein LOC141646931 n=1 Tax=Silene latifolia TaxID=37657 RepID=UPI003D77348C
MGGGGAMRAATKLAGISTFTTPFRSATASITNPPSNTAARPISATVCDSGVKFEQSTHRPAWELDDWEIASCFENEQQQYEKPKHEDEELLLVSDKYGYDRVVFGPVPTFEETKEATLELKDALEMVYLSSPKSSGSVGSLSSVPETKACITHESSASKGALQAFMLLKENPAAQTVVASIASDPNVWTAVLQNPTLMEFLESEKKYGTQEPFKTPVDATSSKSSINIDAAEEQGKSDGFMGLLQDVKVTVVDMVSRLSSFVESLFNVPDVEKKDETCHDSSKTFFAGGTFMALAMMVIMIVLMKRN